MGGPERETIVIIPGEDDGSLVQETEGEVVERLNLKVEVTEFSGELDMGCERKRSSECLICLA